MSKNDPVIVRCSKGHKGVTSREFATECLVPYCASPVAMVDDRLSEVYNHLGITTVGELIEQLKRFSPTLPIVCGPNGYDSEESVGAYPVICTRVQCAFPLFLQEAVVL